MRPVLVIIRWKDVRAFWDGGAGCWPAQRTRFLRAPPTIEASWRGASRILLVAVDDVATIVLDCAQFTAADFDEMMRHLRLFERTGEIGRQTWWMRLRAIVLSSSDMSAPERSGEPSGD